MKKNFIVLTIVCLMMSACTSKQTRENPFLIGYNTPFEVPPFDEIVIEDYEPAFMAGMMEQNENIAAIVANNDSPTFDNVIVALEESSPILDRVSNVFFNLTSAETNDSLKQISLAILPLLTKHNDDIYLNEALFSRVDDLYQNRQSQSLTKEQSRLLDKVYNKFLRSGAKLSDSEKTKLREINEKLASLGLQFGDNILNEDNTYKLYIEDEKSLGGLPEAFIENAASEAKANGKEGKWLVTLHNSSRLPFLQYAKDRELRKELFTAYINRGNNQNENNNKQIITEIIKLRLEKAKLLGYNNYANFVLAENMAKDSETVMTFLNNLWPYAISKANKERNDLQKMMNSEGIEGELQGWDWWYYTTKLRQERFNMDENEVKPYFTLENVRDGAFDVASKLYDISFTKLQNIPVYHPDVEVFEVKTTDGKHLGVFYVDYFPRLGKRSGAWMNTYRDQKLGVRPLVCNVASFTKPTETTPSLLTLDEVRTLFHELGHGLHGLLTECNYTGVSGTNVARDFVELPSQMNEHWAFEPEVLKMYAKHYETGEVISDQLIEKIQEQSTFNEGFRTTELLAAALLDMELHCLENIDADFDIEEFETNKMKQLGLPSLIPPRYRTTYFNHIIGGYAAGYYSYLWSNILDNDAFEAFKERGIFNKEEADKYKNVILRKGNTADPMELYIDFRGKEPQLEPMLKDRGLI